MPPEGVEPFRRLKKEEKEIKATEKEFDSERCLAI